MLRKNKKYLGLQNKRVFQTYIRNVYLEGICFKTNTITNKIK